MRADPIHNPIKAWVFDAYGTLFDPYSVQRKAETKFPGKGEALSRLWRSRQLEYTWLRALMNHYADFWQITREALAYACRSLGLRCEAHEQEDLMQEYLSLDVYPDVTEGLKALPSQRRAILSNGSPRMLEAVVGHAGLGHVVPLVLSVDKVKTYKPRPAVYQLAVEALELNRSDIGFVSSNYWDVAGAANFGFPSFWLNRSKAISDELGTAHDVTLTSLRELTDLI
jgi:2-haloacid dehalogenase